MAIRALPRNSGFLLQFGLLMYLFSIGFLLYQTTRPAVITAPVSTLPEHTHFRRNQLDTSHGQPQPDSYDVIWDTEFSHQEMNDGVEGHGNESQGKGIDSNPESRASGSSGTEGRQGHPSAGDPARVRPFPPLHRPVLDNGLDCGLLWQGEEREVGKALGVLNDTMPARRPQGFYQDIASDCSRYRQQQGYIENVSEEERGFPLAFSVMIYKDVEQVERLLRAVYRPHNVYCLHVDLKASSQLVQDLKSLVQCLPGVFWCEDRVDVVWGKFSVLKMELNCMEVLWGAGVTWRYLINLTGQEFPLKTNRELVRILQVYRGANDILGEPPKDKNKWRWQKAGKPPHNIIVAKGPVHLAASRGFVDFLLHSQQARDFLNWTKRTGIPDETFFATLNNQHQLGVPGSYTGNLTAPHHIMLNRFKIWDVSNRTCSGRFVRHICHLGPREVSVMTRSRHLVANKFTYDFQPLAWDCLEQWYFERVRREEDTGEVQVDTDPYRHLALVQHALRPQHSPWG